MRRRAKVGTCPRCHQVVLSGLDADVAALPAHVAPERLSGLGEALALAGGRQTYSMDYGQYLNRRDGAGIIARYPAGRTYVHAEHKCDMPIPREWCAPIPARPNPEKFLTDSYPAPPLPGRGQGVADPVMTRATELLAQMLGATVVREHRTYGEAS